MRRILINGSLAALVALAGLAAESGALGISPLVAFAGQATPDPQEGTTGGPGEREHPCRKTFNARTAGPRHCDPDK